jgi:hypothetical protein
MKTLWCKNQTNPSDRISHAWALLRFLRFYTFSLAKNSGIYTKFTIPRKQRVGLQNGTENAAEVICCLLTEPTLTNRLVSIKLHSLCSNPNP